MSNSPITLEGLQQPDYLSDLHGVANIYRPELYRMDSAGMRFYYRIDQQQQVRFYGSVTSVKRQVTGLAPAIVEKKVSMGKEAFDAYLNERALFGTFFHIQAAEYTKSGYYELSKLPALIREYVKANNLSKSQTAYWQDMLAKGLQAWCLTMQEYDIKPIAVELPLYSDACGVAGTIDLVCEMNAKKYSEATPPEKRKRIIAIIDWKSGGIFDDYAFQLELNKLTWSERFPDAPPITHLYNWTWNDWRAKPTYTLKDQTDSKYADPELIQAYLKIYAKQGALEPKPVRTLTQGQLSATANLAKMATYIDPRSYILHKHATTNKSN